MQSRGAAGAGTLDRTHDPAPGRRRRSRWARAAGFEQVSLDLIYGTPGESPTTGGASLDAALACEPDHVSAYALIVEDGTRLAAAGAPRRARGAGRRRLADRYELADEVLAAAGLRWYEVSNWARAEPTRCRHNLGYWRGDDWWGVGPGAHSHVGGVRWWNVRHPRGVRRRGSAAALSPAAAREVLTAEQRRERAGAARRAAAPRGCRSTACRRPAGRAVAGLVADGLVERGRARGRRPC